MKIVSISENQSIEKRIAITPEIAKKYISLGFEVSLCENYGKHLGFDDKEYEDNGVKLFKSQNDVINNANIIVQLSLPGDEKTSLLKINQKKKFWLVHLSLCQNLKKIQ